jgi:hypothetical protein
MDLKTLKHVYIFCFSFFLAPALLNGQQTDSLFEVALANPSLEFARDTSFSLYEYFKAIDSLKADTMVAVTVSNRLPENWGGCKIKNQSYSDIQPGAFGVTLPAIEGRNYVGMVVRENGGFETISQGLPVPLRAGTCYKLSVYMARSDYYSSFIKNKDSVIVNFSRPARLVIWDGSAKDCLFSADKMLASSPPVVNKTWKKFTFILKPTTDILQLNFSSDHVVEKPYNGNLLLDNLSNLVPVVCETGELMPLTQTEIAEHPIVKIQRIIDNTADSLVFEPKSNTFKYTTTFDQTDKPRNLAYERVLDLLLKYPELRLVVRVTAGGQMGKKRAAYLNAYALQYLEISAKRVDIKLFKDEDLDDERWQLVNDDFYMKFVLNE